MGLYHSLSALSILPSKKIANCESVRLQFLDIKLSLIDYILLKIYPEK